jgi:CheY-like chemotaxis protein
MSETAHILLVEDDLILRTILANRLTAAGYAVDLAADGREGLERARAQPPEVIISDWIMPELDGAEFCRLVKQQDPLQTVYFIMLTARDAPQDKVTALDLGADDYLAKPFDHQELLARVRVGLRLRQMQQEMARLEHQVALVEMAVTLAHEINNPLMGILGYVEMVRPEVRAAGLADIDARLADVEALSQRIADVVRRLNRLQEPQWKPYLDQTRMVDLGALGT